MGFLNKLKNKVHKVTDQVADTVDDLTDNIKVSSEERDRRFLICTDCDKLNKELYTCKECGCFMKVKTWITFAECPLKKW